MPPEKPRISPESYANLSPRKLAIWPASGKTFPDPHYTVTVNLDHKLVDWLFANLVRTEAAFGDLEETIQTALYDLLPDELKEPGLSDPAAVEVENDFHDPDMPELRDRDTSDPV